VCTVRVICLLAVNEADVVAACSQNATIRCGETVARRRGLWCKFEGRVKCGARKLHDSSSPTPLTKPAWCSALK